MKRVVPVMMCLLLLCLSLLANTVDKNTILRSSIIDQNVLSDYILLKNGDRLAGTIMNDKFTLITFYSEIEIPREYIAEIDLEKEKALVDMKASGHLSGFVTKEEVLLKLSNGTEVTLRIEDIRKIVFKSINETTQGNWQTVYIQNGDYFKGKVTNEDLQIRTTYGRIPINLEMMKRIDFYNIDGIAAVELLDGGVVHGIVEPDEIDILLSFGPAIQVYKNRIAKIENPDKEAPETIQVMEAGCTLEIVAGNELAKEAFVLVDGEKAGTLNSGSLTISGLSVGSHIITMDGESIDTQKIEVVFAEKLESKEINIQAKHATRAVRIKTEPTGARIWIDGKELSSTSPWQEVLEVGKEYHIEVVKENHGKSELILDLKTKGEMILLEINIPEATTEKPQLKYPENGTKDIAAGAVTLIWESDERVASFIVEFDGKTYQTKSNYLSVDADKSGKIYSWKVTAINEFGKEATSDEYSFTTMENRAPNVPSTPSPHNYSTNQPLTVTLSWECSDPDEDSLTFDVYFDTSSNPTTQVSTNQSGKTFSISNLSAGTTYYWKVLAKDSKGATAEGPVWSFATETGGSSSATPSPNPMPTARSWLAAVNIENKIMVIGGGDRITKTSYANNEIYNPITNSWETLTPMPTPRYALAAAEYNGKVYVFGGQKIFGNASPVNKVEIYDPATDSWSTGSPMPKAMCEIAAATCGDKIYVIAGLNYATRYNALQIYSPGTDSWSVGAPLPKAFSQHAAVGYGGKVYVFGGMDNSRNRLDTVYIYDPQSDTWSSGTPAPTARSELAAAVVGGKIYIFGGITKDFTEGLTTVDIYDPLSDSWQKGDPSLSKRSALAAASVGSKAYLIGGYLYGNPVIELDSIEAYSIE